MSYKKLYFYFIVFLILIGCATNSNLEQDKKKIDYVPDSQTAIAIATAVLAPIYGEKSVRDEQPFHAQLQDKVWIVVGTLHQNMPGKIVIGGVSEVKISKKDGRIISVTHGE